MRILDRFCPPTLAAASDVDARWLAAIAGVAIALFVWTALNLTAGSALHGWDAQVAQWLQAARTPALTEFMLFVTQANSNFAINLYVAFIALVWASCRAWQPVALLVWVIPGGMLLNNIVKHLIARPRPLADEALLHLSTFSFPSGHMAGATLFYGLAAVLLSRSKPRGLVALIYIGAVAMIALTGASRIYLGVHYFSDVVGGLSLGAAWLTGSLLLARGLLRNPVSQQGEKRGPTA